MRISSFFFASFIISCYLPTAHLFLATSPTANLSTTWTGRHVGDKHNVLLRETDTATFACGFFCSKSNALFHATYADTTACTDFIFTIFLIDTSTHHMLSDHVWSANRNEPVEANSILNFTAAGELFLQDVNGRIVWTTNTAGKSVTGMNLTETGNLVLHDDQNSVVWQSFDHPTDSLLPGQKLYQGQKLRSRRSVTLPFEGHFSLHVTDTGLEAYVESYTPLVYFSKFVKGMDTYKGRRYVMFWNGTLSFPTDSSEPSDDRMYMPRANQLMKLMPDGHLYVIDFQYRPWKITELLKTFHVGKCGHPSVCGINSICLTNEQCSCPETEYFRPVDSRRPKLGCFEITPLSCNSTQDQHFIILKNVTSFTSTADMVGVNMETCKQSCQHNCSCKAAFFKYDSNASNGECFLPSEITMKTVDDAKALAFIKVQNVTSHRVSPQGATVVRFVFLVVVAIVSVWYLFHKGKTDAEMVEEYLDQVPGMPKCFSYQELKTATENFSKKLGEGGFGSVFEGTLRDGTKIAVKILEGVFRAHLKKSFEAEVHSIGSIHHVNLVRLRGFCARKSERFLVYDFMSNGSLDKWIYHGKREHVLEWERRKKIITDIAKGLTYLHEDCRQKIVHLDIKPQNILLDNDLNAKVSDFGLSKLIDKNQSEVTNTIRGTPGYIAPELWSSRPHISVKADVYNFGIVLLEILCGRKNVDRSEPEESEHLLFVFEKCWEQGTLSDMVDRHSEDMQAHKTEVVEIMQVAAWCLQTNSKRRPSMSLVVKVLEGGMNVESNLIYNFTKYS